jgi:hypothetical protein
MRSNILAEEVAARRVAGLSLDIRWLPCPTRRNHTVDLKREKPILSNGPHAMKVPIPKPRRSLAVPRKRETAVGTGIHHDGNRSLNKSGKYSVLPAHARGRT